MNKDCCHTHNYTNNPSDKSVSAGKYYCPIQCEGDKIYEQAGDCQVCGMRLVKENTKQQLSVLALNSPCLKKF